MTKYSKGAGAKVKEALHEQKEGTLETGSGKKVTSRKQAIAIGLSEAREKGEKVPAKKNASSKSNAKSGVKKGATKKGVAKKSTTKKSGTKKTVAKKAASKK